VFLGYFFKFSFIMLDKTLNPATFEIEIYKEWEAKGAFKADPNSKMPPYCIMMPPPNVTGSLHVGHALTYTLQDILVRFKRMNGFNVLWQPGTDHGGIATQLVVERQLESGTTRKGMGKDAFLERVRAWKDESGSAIVNQQKRLGISPDWDRQKYTMDDDLCEVVSKCFISLYKEGLIYKDKRLVNWDAHFQTAISDLEVNHKEANHFMWSIRYVLDARPDESIIVATTRPETLFGDVAVAVHPDDDRYKHLIGQMVRLPITNRCIPIIADEYCDMELGTGAVKITPAHDFNDFEVGKRHQLAPIIMMDSFCKLNANTPDGYNGLHYEEARKKILIELEEKELLVESKPIKHTVPVADRSGIEIQPYLTDQWYMNVKPLAEKALQAVEKGDTAFFPSHWKSTYDEWLNNIEPWCISRQIWWGHPIPAWYGPDGHVFVGEIIEEVRREATSHYGHEVELTQDSDVLDTWFSSALWPFSTLGWPEQTDELKTYYPTSVLVTGFDIIFFWVARMMMMGIHFMDDIPFKDIYIHAIVRDEKGRKMSKTTGNVINPLTMIDQFGTDALRFTLAHLSVPGRDIRLGESKIETNRNFMTKIWNAARFLEMNGCFEHMIFDKPTPSHDINQWILDQVALCADSIGESLNKYRFDEASMTLYRFIWGTFCDDYIELIKPLIHPEFNDDQLKLETKKTAMFVFQTILKIMQPFVPYLSQYLWAYLGGDGLLMVQQWPKFPCDHKESSERVQWILDGVQKIRSLRSALRISPALKINLWREKAPDWLPNHMSSFEKLARLGSINNDPTCPPQTVRLVHGGYVMGLCVGDAIDLNNEIDRLKKEKQSFEDIKMDCEKRLSNTQFMERAKESAIEEIQLRLKDVIENSERIDFILNNLG
jgi:valyl-tRNA synthetase